jgi:hypothetical protein
MLNHRNINRFALAVSGTAALVVGFGWVGSVAQAAETGTVQAEFVSSLTLDVSLPAAGAVDDIAVAPMAGGGAPSEGRLDARVQTGSANGAQLDCAMISGDVYNGDLAGLADDSRRIGRLAGDGSDVGVNHWGARWFDISSLVDDDYDIDTADVSTADLALAGAAGYWWAVPDYGSPRHLFDSGNFGSAGMRTARFVVGVRVDFSLPADKYSNEMVFTASMNAGI